MSGLYGIPQGLFLKMLEVSQEHEMKLRITIGHILEIEKKWEYMFWKSSMSIPSLNEEKFQSFYCVALRNFLTDL